MAAEQLLFQKQSKKNKVKNSTDLFVFSTLIFPIAYRFLYYSNTLLFLIPFICELWFTFFYALLINTRWSPLHFSTNPPPLWSQEEDDLLPPLDVFVTTADPLLEPPIVTVNTVLSLLAMDYPSHKLSCYVSDDAASPLVFYSLIHAAVFAQAWVPFCRKYNLQLRAPFRYFSQEISPPPPPPPGSWSPAFEDEAKNMKREYDGLVMKLEEAGRGVLELNAAASEMFYDIIDRGNHGSIVKVIWENSKGVKDGVPHLVYVSREKRPNHHHHYKAGAMNVLTRVSGVMTNAPFILNLDCDMFCNNPKVVIHAMCLLLGVDDDRDCGFVQFPQYFYNVFGAPILIANRFIFPGIGGIQGPFYMGTGCFHRRKVIYGSTASESGIKGKNPSSYDELSNYKLGKRFGNSVEFVKSAREVLLDSRKWSNIIYEPSSSVEAAKKVAASDYEIGTRWGTEVGLMYGSCTEDVLTGLVIHQRGWVSAFIDVEPQAFLGYAPNGGLAAMNQSKRWITGTSEILFSKHNPLIGFALFNALMIDRLHHYIRELRALRKLTEAGSKRQTQGTGGGAGLDDSRFMEEISTLEEKIKKIEGNSGELEKEKKAAQAEVEALKKQSESFLLEYDRVLEENQSLRSQLNSIDLSEAKKTS